MMEFVDYSVDKLKDYIPYIKQSPYLCSDVSLGASLMWNKDVNLQFAVFNNTLVIKRDVGDSQ